MERENKLGLINRLRRVEGQVRGVARMLEEDRYCIDVLNQLQAIHAALGRVEATMLKTHLNHCIESAIVGGDQMEQRQKAGELIELLERRARPRRSRIILGLATCATILGLTSGASAQSMPDMPAMPAGQRTFRPGAGRRRRDDHGPQRHDPGHDDDGRPAWPLCDDA